jgi:hypothetical protein
MVVTTLFASGCSEEDLLALIPDDRYEPNDRVESAYDMTGTDVTNASVTYIDAVDYFTFQTPADVDGGVEITCTLVPGAFTLRLLSMDETELESVDGQAGVALIDTSAVSPETWYLIHVELLQPMEGDTSSYDLSIVYP